MDALFIVLAVLGCLFLLLLAVIGCMVWEMTVCDKIADAFSEGLAALTRHIL